MNPANQPTFRPHKLIEYESSPKRCNNLFPKSVWVFVYAYNCLFVQMRLYPNYVI